MKKYYQEETSKALLNFKISNVPVHLKLIYAVVTVKKAATFANLSIGRLDKRKAEAILGAIEKILAGEFDTQFVTDQVQGGAGTSINMNVNEVISTIAQDMLGDGTAVNPFDDVNMGQSTNDVIPTAIKLVLLHEMDDLLTEIDSLAISCRAKQKEFSNIIKVGRTHLQDAVPMTLGQSFGAYASFFERNQIRLSENKKYLLETNLGGTAIGSGINSSVSYIKSVNEALSEATGYSFTSATDLFDSTQNSDIFTHIAFLLKSFAGGISKIFNDLRMLASGPRAGLSEIILPELQKGSSIMPAKVNPVVLEMLNQVCYQVYGNVETAFHAGINGQFELNVMLPIYIKNMLESFELIISGLKEFDAKVLKEVQPNRERIAKLFESSLSMSTALNRYIGYDKTTELVKRSTKNGTSLIVELKKENILSDDEIEGILDPKTLTQPTNT
jgi:aspartate ammonia-lyase